METARYLARLVRQIAKGSIPGGARSLVRQHLLDALASAFVGCRNQTFEDLTGLSHKDAVGCTLPGGLVQRSTPLDAAMLWAFAINASVFEDGSRDGACHPAAAVMPAAAALSEGCTWERVDAAVVAGYEVMIRLARGGNPEFTRRGFHPTSIIAPFAAAATASLLLGQDAAQCQNALCLAAQGSAGLMSAFRCGQTQPLQVAWAVRNGISAALMAGAGHQGYPGIIEDAFYPAYLGHDPSPPVEEAFPYEYAVEGTYLKPYPGCRHLHPSIDALVKILEKSRIEASDITKIRVGTYRTALETEIHTVNSRGDAYFNIPYALAARIALGRNDWDAFDPAHFEDAFLNEVREKVEVAVDPEIDRLYPGQRGSRVAVHTADGACLHAKVDHPLGEPENPLPLSFTLKKLRNTASPFLPDHAMERIEGIREIRAPSVTPPGLFEALGERRPEKV